MVRRPFTEREGGEREREGVREREREREGGEREREGVRETEFFTEFKHISFIKPQFSILILKLTDETNA